MLTNKQNEKIDEMVKNSGYESEIKRCQLEASLVSMCTSSPAVLLQTIIDVSWEAAVSYIETIKQLECCNDDWKLSDDYENKEIRNIHTLRKITKSVKCSYLNKEVFKESIQSIYDKGWDHLALDLQVIQIKGALADVLKDIKILAVDKPEAVLWFFLNSESLAECLTLHGLLQGLNVL